MFLYWYFYILIYRLFNQKVVADLPLAKSRVSEDFFGFFSENVTFLFFSIVSYAFKGVLSIAHSFWKFPMFVRTKWTSSSVRGAVQSTVHSGCKKASEGPHHIRFAGRLSPLSPLIWRTKQISPSFSLEVVHLLKIVETSFGLTIVIKRCVSFKIEQKVISIFTFYYFVV